MFNNLTQTHQLPLCFPEVLQSLDFKQRTEGRVPALLRDWFIAQTHELPGSGNPQNH